MYFVTSRKNKIKQFFRTQYNMIAKPFNLNVLKKTKIRYLRQTAIKML